MNRMHYIGLDVHGRRSATCTVLVARHIETATHDLECVVKRYQDLRYQDLKAQGL
jgi:hypothetical protein